MFEKLEVNHFRLFDELKLDNLGQFNIVAGANNSGKTALLEAIFLLIGTTNIELIRRLPVFRGLHSFGATQVENIQRLLWDYLFYNNNTEVPVEIIGFREKKPYSLKLRVSSDNWVSSPLEKRANKRAVPPVTEESVSFSGNVLQSTFNSPFDREKKSVLRFEDGELKWRTEAVKRDLGGIYLASRQPLISADFAERYSKLDIEGDSLHDVVHALQIIEPSLKRLSMAYMAGQPQVFGEIAPFTRLIPLAYMGDGMSHVMNILLGIADQRGKYVLIDEVENGLHYSKLSSVWQVIFRAAIKYNVQLFVSTHSFECIRAAFEASEKEQCSNALRFHRLDRRDGTVKATVFSSNELNIAFENSLEIR